VVVVEAGDVGDGVVRDVELLQRGEAGEPAQLAEPVRLDGEDLEAGEAVEVLRVGWSACGRIAPADERAPTLSSVILFFPNHSSSSPCKVSMFSIS
jgi:hypothetical protein